MKEYLYLISIVLFVTACTEEFDKASGLIPSTNAVPPKTLRSLEISRTQFSYLASGNEAKTLMISSDHSPWIIENNNDWIHLSSTQGDTDTDIKISIDDNLEMVTREGIVVVKSAVKEWVHEQSITIQQDAAKACINVEKQAYDVSARANSLSVKVDSNCEWKLDDLSSVSWLHVSYTDDMVNISVDGNDSGWYRSARIWLRSTDKTAVNFIDINQAEPNITASSTEITIPTEGGEVEVTVDADAHWKATVVHNGFHITPEEGDEGKTKITFTADKNIYGNTRTGIIFLSIGGRERIYFYVTKEE